MQSKLARVAAINATHGMPNVNRLQSPIDRMAHTVRKNNTELIFLQYSIKSRSLAPTSPNKLNFIYLVILISTMGCAQKKVLRLVIMLTDYRVDRFFKILNPQIT